MYILVSRAYNGVIKKSASYREARDTYFEYIKQHPEDQCGVFLTGSQSALHWNFGS